MHPFNWKFGPSGTPCLQPCDILCHSDSIKKKPDMKGNHIFMRRAAISCLRKCLTCIHPNVFRCCGTCLGDAMLQKEHQYAPGMAAKLQHALRWIRFCVKI